MVVLLPDDQHMVIDCKLSLLAYEQAINCTDIEQQQRALQQHVRSVKQHVDGLAKKDYSQLPELNSPSFVLLYMPLEPAYMAALQQDPNLYEYAMHKQVLLVSHTTLMPILKTVANLWTLQQGNQQAQRIRDPAGEVYNQVAILAARFDKLGASLQATSNHFNQCVTALTGQQGVQTKAKQFKQISNKANKPMPEPQPIDVHTKSTNSDTQPQLADADLSTL